MDVKGTAICVAPIGKSQPNELKGAFDVEERDGISAANSHGVAIGVESSTTWADRDRFSEGDAAIGVKGVFTTACQGGTQRGFGAIRYRSAAAGRASREHEHG